MKAKIKGTPYDYLYFLYYANLPLTGGHREYFTRIWNKLDKVIEINYDKKKKFDMYK